MNDDLTTELRRQLAAQADDWHGAPLTLDSVRGRAHSIRRTRRILTGSAAAAAVAAVIVPTMVLLGTDMDADRDIPPTGPSPTRVVDTPAPTPRADGTFPLTFDVAEGEPPASGYLVFDDQTWVTRDATRELPGRFLQLLPLGDGWMGVRGPGPAGGDLEVVELDAELAEVSATPAAAGIVSTSDGDRLAWIEKTGAGDGWTLVKASIDGSEQVRTTVPADSVVEGFVTADTVVSASTDPVTGQISYGATEGSVVGRALDGFQVVGGLSDAAGLVAGQTEFNGDSTCSEIRDTTTAEVVVPTCDYQLGAFSPDGRWLIGYASYYDYGSPSLAILDATTGLPVVEWTSSREQAEAAVVLAAAWEDDDTVVATVNQGGEQAVLTFEANGAVARASELREEQMSVEFFLPAAIAGQ